MEQDCDDSLNHQQQQQQIIASGEIESADLTCRLCANPSARVIGIYSEEGVSNELANKMNLYLPIKVSDRDGLPLHCCWNCASTVLAWHELVLACVEADRRLRDLPEQKVSLDAFESPDSSNKAKLKSASEGGNKASLDAAAAAFRQQANDAAAAASPKLEESSEEDAFLEESDEEEEEEAKLAVVKPDAEQQQLKYSVSCQLCSQEFEREEEVFEHVKDRHPDKKDFVTVTQAALKEKRKHNKLDQDAVSAAKVVIDGRVYYNCNVCGKSLYSPYTYIWHTRIHTGERPFVCDLCGKQFRVSQGLVRHLRETHEGIKNFPCDLCGRMFATRRNVEEHRRIHTNERPYVCDLCGKAFKQKASLFVHNRSHTDSFPFRCSYCNQGFRTRPTLMLHVTRHTGEKPYPCDVCGRCFRIKYELKRHQLIHSDEKPFSCADCGLSFRQKRYLRNHNKTNHNRSGGGGAD